MVESTDLYSRAPTFHDTDAGYIVPNEFVSSFTNRIVSFVTPFSLRPLADHFLTPSPAEHSRIHDLHLSLVALPDNLVVHNPVSELHPILGIGCGTGIVTRHIGNTQFPMPPTSTAPTWMRDKLRVCKKEIAPLERTNEAPSFYQSSTLHVHHQSHPSPH